MNSPKENIIPSSSALTGAEIIAAVSAMTPAEIIATANALTGLDLKLRGKNAVISLAHLDRFVLDRQATEADPHDPTNWTRERILEEARSWGVMHGEAYAHNREIFDAVRAGEEVDWLDDADMLWEGLGFDDEDLRLPPEDLKIEAEEVAMEAAQEAGEQQVATMTPDQGASE